MTDEGRRASPPRGSGLSQGLKTETERLRQRRRNGRRQPPTDHIIHALEINTEQIHILAWCRHPTAAGGRSSWCLKYFSFTPCISPDAQAETAAAPSTPVLRSPGPVWTQNTGLKPNKSVLQSTTVWSLRSRISVFVPLLCENTRLNWLNAAESFTLHSGVTLPPSAPPRTFSFYMSVHICWCLYVLKVEQQPGQLFHLLPKCKVPEYQTRHVVFSLCLVIWSVTGLQKEGGKEDKRFISQVRSGDGTELSPECQRR